MKILLVNFSFLFFTTIFSQSIENAHLLIEKGEYKNALEVLNNCEKSEKTQILKAKANYFLGYVNFACLSLEMLDGGKADLVYDSLCTMSVEVLNLPKDANGDYFYQEVITMEDSISAEDLFELIKEWFVLSFDSLHSVISYTDKESYKIIGNCRIKYNTLVEGKPKNKYSGYFSFNIIFECRENRFKYRIEKINHKALTNKFSLGLNFKEKPVAKNLTSDGMRKLIIYDFPDYFDNLLSTIRNIKPLTKEEDNW